MSALTKEVNIHALIQEEDTYIYDLIQKYRDRVDDHVLNCTNCHEKVMIYTHELPRLLDQMSVEVQDMAQLKKGQCLPCGCVVTSTQWTYDMAMDNYINALSKIAGLSKEVVRKIQGDTRLYDLPLTVIQLRRLRDTFYIPDMSLCSPELRDEEEGDEVVDLPETIDQFVDTILRFNSGYSVAQCPDCWSPG